jgi:16S rRNA (guanine527-N7)-methyltransferase
MKTLSASEISNALEPYGATIGPATADRIRAYIALLLKWNRSISLTTVTDPAEIVKFHFGESVFAASALKFAESRLADVGAGAGFPGLPLALDAFSLDVTLIESNTKKCAFLSEVIRALNLPNATVFRGRMEEFPPGSADFDFITARALGQFDDLLKWSLTHLAPGGKVVLWLGDDDARELSRAPGWTWDRPILIPGSKRRYLLVGSIGQDRLSDSSR